METDKLCITEIKNIIHQVKAVFYQMKNILRKKSLELKIRKRILECFMEPVVTDGCESWIVNKVTTKPLRLLKKKKKKRLRHKDNLSQKLKRAKHLR